METEISDVRKNIDASLSMLDRFITQMQLERDKIQKEIESRTEQLSFGKYDKAELDSFLKEPYVIIPKRDNEYYVISPRWIDFHLGWLERRTASYNIFVVNRYMQWIAPIPKALREKMKFPEPLPFKIVDGVMLTGREHQDDGWNKYKGYLTGREGNDRLKIKHGSEFKLLAQLIEDGILPFIPRAIDSDDIRDWKGMELRDYQKRAWTEFIERGAVGIFWAFGAGKSLFGVYALGRIKGEKLVVVPTLTLKEQWEERIRKYLPDYPLETEVVTYNAFEKVRNKEYALIIFDECHRLPATTFIRLSTLRTKYRMGLSGSPFREDKRENYIFALTGYPLGMDWDELLENDIVHAPIFKLYLPKDGREKMTKLAELLKLPLKTIIFCDSLELGERISKQFSIPFVSGETRGRMDIIRQADVSVVSRVGDEGISLPDLERVIEISFLFGSRAQESQRFGRLLHSKRDTTEHIILMTEAEYEAYEKRLYAITERGFHIEVMR